MLLQFPEAYVQIKLGHRVSEGTHPMCLCYKAARNDCGECAMEVSDNMQS